MRKPIKIENYRCTDVLKSQIILHYSEKKIDELREYFNNFPEPKGCAYAIGQEGIVYEMFSPSYYSSHIGFEHYAAEIRSIGIVMLADPKQRIIRGKKVLQHYTMAQTRAMLDLCFNLEKRFKIKHNVILNKERTLDAVLLKSGIYLHDSYGNVNEFPQIAINELIKAFNR